MTAFDYARLSARAASLIERFGQSVTLRRNDGTNGNQWNPLNLGNTDYTVTAVDLGIQNMREAGSLLTERKRTLIVSTAAAMNQETQESVAGFVPTQGERVILGGAEHVIREVRPMAPGGTAVYYELDLET